MAEAVPAGGLNVGTILAGTYKVTGLLGRGGMGSVWAAEHLRLPGKKVAIKVLHAEVAADAESLARFRREAEIASRLGHPNIVDVHDFNFLDDGAPYLVLEYLEGEDLAARLARGPMPLDHVLAVVRQVGSALQAAHRENIIHRDLKPQNVFLVPTEADGFITERAKVLDFGISKIRGSNTVKTNASTMLGTPQYMAPEQAIGDHDAVDARTDVFALGAMVYEMLSGKPAFGGLTIPEVVFKVVYEDPARLSDHVSLPPGIVDAVHKALSKKQEERFQDISEFVEALTGSPLSTTKRDQPVIVPSDGASQGAATTPPVTPAPIESKAAYAATIGSGPRDVEPVMDPAIASTMASGEHAVNEATAATIASGTDVGSIVTPVRQTGAAETTKPGSGKGMWIGLALAAAIAGGIAVFFVMKGGSSDDTNDAVAAGASDDARLGLGDLLGKTKNHKDLGDTVNDLKNIAKDVEAVFKGDANKNAIKNDTVVKDAVVKDAVVKDAANKDATKKDAVVKDAAKKPNKDKAKNHAVVKKSGSGASHTVAAKQPGAVIAALKQAEAKLRSGDAGGAVRVARRSLSIKRTQAAYALMARAYCSQSNLGMAQANLRNVRRRALCRKVAKYCRKRGVDLEP